MNKDLLGLVELQNIDSRIMELVQSKKEFPADTEKLRKGIADAEATVVLCEKKITALETERKSITEQIEQAKQGLAKSEERLNSITTNREYDAVHSEIETQKHLIVNGENRLKTFGQDTERLAAQKQEAIKEAERVKAESQPRIDELAGKIKSVDDDIAAAKKVRDALVPGLNRQFLRTYEHVIKRRKSGRVLSLVSMADGTCQICHKILEAQLLSEIRKSVKLHICESCGSLLVWNVQEVDAGGAAPKPAPSRPPAEQGAGAETGDRAPDIEQA